MAASRRQLNSKAAINRIKVESLPYFVFAGDSDIVPYGLDNLYPRRIIQAVKKSPTALGCIKRQSEFIFGQGLADGHGDIIVNRDEETLNDIVSKAIRNGYSALGGFALHFNFNSLGQICEIFNIELEFVRKHKELRKVDYGLWREDNHSSLGREYITLDLYGKSDPVSGFALDGLDYKGQVFYFARDGEIYPTSPLDSAVISASYEKEAQIYTYANIRNGFSGTTIIKMPTVQTGDKAVQEAEQVQNNIQSLHGADRAGSSLVISVPVDADGAPKPFQMVENLSPTNIDGLFEKQNLKAEKDILKVYNMPGELIGIPASGAFSRAAYDDAFNMKNSDTEIDRNTVEREFNKFLDKSVFGVSEIELVPLKLKGEEAEVKEKTV